MDTLTHALSGALLARATAPDPAKARISTAARVAGGFLAAAFPDIDFVLGYVSPVAYLTGHRGVTHSIFLLPVWAVLLAWILAQIDRGKAVTWRDYLGVCALGVGVHIVGDLITSFGTMIYAPLSDARVAWDTTFIIDLSFSGIIVAGLIGSLVWRRSRVPAVLGLTALASYVGFQAVLHSRAVDFGAEYARRAGFGAPKVTAIPRPVSPFNWTVFITEGDRYHYAHVNLAREQMLRPPGPDAGLFERYGAPYAPLSQAKWIAIDVYGQEVAGRELAARVLADPRLGFFRWFAEFPALYRIDHGNPSTCVWFQDLRFVTPGSDRNSFRYGLCREDGSEDWHPYRLLGDGRREPAG
ncbi:MAG: metal-dependent hydrolase [Burkholderiales bacterium]